MKEKIDELEEKIMHLEKKRRGIVRDKIREAEEMCDTDFKKYFEGSKFDIKDLPNILTAEYGTTKFTLEKHEETKIRGCMRLRSEGALKTDKNIKVELNTKPIGLKNEVESFNNLEDADDSYYESELDRINDVVEESEKIVSYTEQSNIKLSFVDTESLREKDSISWESEDGHTFFIPEYTGKIKSYTFPTLIDFFKHEFG